jgi:hypothetical protein
MVTKRGTHMTWRMTRHMVVVAALSCTTATAFADHDTHRSLIQNSAYTLDPGTVQIGLWTSGVGITKNIMVSTATPWWIAGVPFGILAPNLALKGSLPVTTELTLSLTAGALYAFELSKIAATGTNVSLGIIPVTASASFHVEENYVISFETTYTALSGNITLAEDDSDDFNSAVGTADMLSVTGSVYAYLSKKFALIGQASYLPYHGSVISEVNTQTGDTTISAQAELRAEELNNAFSVMGGAAFSWGAFNLQAGLGYGNIFLTGLGLVVPSRMVYPYLNFYARL